MTVPDAPFRTYSLSSARLNLDAPCPPHIVQFNFITYDDPNPDAMPSRVIRAQPMKIIVALTALGSSLRGYAAGQSLTQDLFLAEQACKEFEAELPSSSGWLVDDCMSVWNSWAVTVPRNIPLKYNDTDFFDGIVAHHRGPGSHCLVKSIDYPDGAGSMALRHLSTWVRRALWEEDVNTKPSSTGDNIVTIPEFFASSKV